MSNPFDDDDDSHFSSNGGNRRAKYTDSSANEDPEDEMNVYETQIRQAMEGTLQSTQRSKQMLDESEDAGLKTAEELSRQREQLDNTNKNLDQINASTTQTQKHLNNIKSIFGGFKNRFSKSKSNQAIAEETKAPTNLQKTVDKMQTDTSGFYEQPSGGFVASGGSLPESSKKNLNEALQEMDREVDENLDDMASQLRRLRGLGTALGDEIKEQNDMLDEIAIKTEKTDGVIRNQDKQMKKILGYPGKK